MRDKSSTCWRWKKKRIRRNQSLLADQNMHDEMDGWSSKGGADWLSSQSLFLMCAFNMYFTFCFHKTILPSIPLIFFTTDWTIRRGGHHLSVIWAGSTNADVLFFFFWIDEAGKINEVRDKHSPSTELNKEMHLLEIFNNTCSSLPHPISIALAIFEKTNLQLRKSFSIASQELLEYNGAAMFEVENFRWLLHWNYFYNFFICSLHPNPNLLHLL